MSVLLAAVVFAQRSSSGGDDAAAGILGLCCACFPFFLLLALFLPMYIGMWKVFEKAGQPGWGALIPIYNLLLLMKIIGQEDSRVIFYFIPIYNIIIGIEDFGVLAKSFGKESGFGIGLLLLPFVFWPMLGFGTAQYNPPPKAVQRPS